MGLISYQQLEDGVTASANLWNERFGVITNEINGNLDGANLKNSSITTAKIADRSVTADKIKTELYVDDNGWTVHDLGTHKIYTRQLTVTGPGGGHNKDKVGKVIQGNGTRAALGEFRPPVGRSNSNINVVATWFGNYTGHLVVAAEPRTFAGLPVVAIEGGNIWPFPLAFEGKVNVQAMETL